MQWSSSACFNGCKRWWWNYKTFYSNYSRSASGTTCIVEFFPTEFRASPVFFEVSQRDDSLQFLFQDFPLRWNFCPALFPVFADYSSHIASTIFAKYRMITRKGNMSIFMYDYYFLFYLIAGWIITLKNGERESLNSFKSWKIFRFSTVLKLSAYSLIKINSDESFVSSLFHFATSCGVLTAKSSHWGAFTAVLSPLTAVASQKICNFNYSVYFHKKLRDFN